MSKVFDKPNDEEDETSSNFAQKFKPTFRACDLATYCNENLRDSTKVAFLKKFEPFVKLKDVKEAAAEKKREAELKKKNPHLLSQKQKEKMKELIDKKIEAKDTSFNDQAVIDSVLIKREPTTSEEENLNELVAKNLVITDDDDENYLTLDESEVDEEDKKEELEKMRQKQAKFYVSTRRGIKLESHIIENINKTKNKNFVQDKKLTTIDCGLFYICGKIDGIDKENKIVIEIKTRNKLDINEKKDTVTSKEKMQALTYMRLFNCTQCWLVEAGPNSETKINVFEWSERDFEEKILKKLSNFCKQVKQMEEKEFIELFRKING